MKMYILVKEDLPVGVALVAVAHASLATYLEFQDKPEMKIWISGPFKKVICRVNVDEFEKAKTIEDRVVITESALDNKEVAIGLCPRNDWPKAVKFYRLFK